MSKLGYWAIKTYKAGNIVEETKYWVAGEKPTGNKRKISSDLKKLAQNEKQCERALARLINENFEEGVLLGFDYDDKSYKRLMERAAVKQDAKRITQRRREKMIEAAEAEFRLFLRRVKRMADKKGVEVKYIAVTSDMDGDTGELVRVHHHVVVNKEAAEIFIAKWGKCKNPDSELLSPQLDRLPLASYLIRQVMYRKNAKAYIVSRNLKRPAPVYRAVKTASELTVPKNGTLIYRSAYAPYLTQYIRYAVHEKRMRSAECGVRNKK